MTTGLKPPSPALANYDVDQRRKGTERLRERIRSGDSLHPNQLAQLTAPELVEYAAMRPSDERERDVGLELLRRAKNRAAKKRDQEAAA